MADETVLAETPAAEPVDLTTKIETPATEVVAEPKPETEVEAEVVETEATEGEDKPKKVPGSQRLKRRLQMIENDVLSITQERDQLLRERDARQAPQNDAGKPGIDREPLETDFPNDWFKYQESKTAWAARQAVRDEFSRAREQEAKTGSERVRRELTQERLDTYHEYAETVRERIPDFDKVVATAASVQVKPELAEELMSSDKSALLQYHLAKNPDKVRELNALSGRELAREIGRLEARVHLPTSKKATEAEAPPSQVRGASAAPVDPFTGPDDMNAYVKWREKQKAS